MRKIFFISVLMTLSSFLFAEVKLESGSLSVLNQAEEYAYVEIDWSKAQVVEFDRSNKVDKTHGTVDQYNKAQGADWIKDWPELKRFIVNCTAWEKYPGRKCFNKKNKDGVLITVPPVVWKEYAKTKDDDLKSHCIWVDPAKAKYKFVLTVTQVDMGSGTASAFGMGKNTGGAIICGKLKLIDIKTGKQLAVLTVDHCKGIGNYSQRSRLVDVVVGEILGNVAELVK